MSFLGFRDGCGGMQPNRVEFEQEKMEGTMKLEGISNDALWFKHCLTNELGLGWVEDEIVLGGSVLGGDDLDGGTDELPVATMGAISLVLSATRLVLLVRSPCYFSLSLLFFREYNSFKGEIKPEMVLHPSNLILQSTEKPIPFVPI